ncbi:hypothetical protein [Peribacillus butanolivorans]|nr:hypothetical protein [Peribacillus butanolivorans]
MGKQERNKCYVQGEMKVVWFMKQLKTVVLHALVKGKFYSSSV